MPLPFELLPFTARRDPFGALTLGGCALPDLVQRFGSPLYIYDGATLDAAAAGYQAALAAHYPGPGAVAYAAKAWLCTATARWAAARGLGLDVVSGSELAIALHAGFPAAQIHFHGNNKSRAELAAALAAGVGRIVVDHAGELELINELARGLGRRQAIWLRINPDVAVDTHSHTRTGHAASKFGLALADGTAAAAVARACALPHLHLLGLHSHIGSQFRDPAPLVAATQRVMRFAGEMQRTTGWQIAEFSPGGGWAVPYTPAQAEGLLPVEEALEPLAAAVVAGCGEQALPLPRLVVEPGRSLVARAGVAVYTVGAVKQAGDTLYAFIDGGLADNPRPALYDAAYHALLANRQGAAERIRVHVAGPYCETGDVLIYDLELPPLQPGDLLAVPVSGAYQLSMASNYNGALRPAVVWVEAGQARLVQRRETVADLLRRDEEPDYPAS